MHLDETCPYLLLSDIVSALRDLKYHACASEVYKIMNRIRGERMGYVQTTTTTTTTTWASTTTTTWASQVEQEDEDLDDQEDEEGGLPRKCSYVF